MIFIKVHWTIYYIQRKRFLASMSLCVTNDPSPPTAYNFPDNASKENLKRPLFIGAISCQSAPSGALMSKATHVASADKR